MERSLVLNSPSRTTLEPGYIIRETYRYYQSNPQNHDLRTRAIAYASAGLLEFEKISAESALALILYNWIAR